MNVKKNHVTSESSIENHKRRRMMGASGNRLDVVWELKNIFARMIEVPKIKEVDFFGKDQREK